MLIRDIARKTDSEYPAIRSSDALPAGQLQRRKTSGTVLESRIPMIMQGTNSGSLIALMLEIQTCTR